MSRHRYREQSGPDVKRCECGCGTPTRILDGLVQRFIRHHQRRLQSGERHPSWRGGRTRSRGYVMVLAHGHPRAGSSNQVFEHILIAERALGRPLPAKHPIHHVDRDRSNNGPGNLVICQDDAYHKLLHKRQRALDACGDASAHRCGLCHGYENQEDITVGKVRTGKFSAYHRRCNNEKAKRLIVRRRAERAS